MQHYDEEKKESPKSTSQSAASAQKAASPAVSPLQQPVWIQSMGNHPPANLQAKLTVSQPGDPYEQEADRVADQVVMRKHKAAPAILGEDEEEQRLMRKQRSSGAQATQGESAPPIVNQALSSGGQPLDTSTRASMESQFGQDFSDVRIHTDGQAAESAQAINARAYTVGKDVVFGEGQYVPGTREGERLLAHELTHVVQQTSFLSSTKMLQRRLNPEDASSEMVGQHFTVTQDFSAPFGKIHPGDVLVVKTWANSSTTVTVALSTPHEHGDVNCSVPKTILTPIQKPTAGIAQYHSGLSAAQSAAIKGQKEIDIWKAKEHTFNTPKGHKLFTAELTRLEGLQTTRVERLNRRLIQEAMFNRFDALIQKWTSFYDAKFKSMGWGSLDPNLVKSIVFNESQMGTSGKYLESAPPWHHPVTTRFNLASAQDSSASALLLMISEMQPALLSTYHLTNIRTDLSAAQTELRQLQAQRSPLNAVQNARRAQLIDLSHPGTTWENFLWPYPGFRDAVNALFASDPAGRPLNEDYEFWIRTAIRWLFEKRRGVGSWEEAIRAYNGSGAAARHYRDIVVGRAQRAQTSGTTGIVPERI